ncbi:FecCD family ABC transporter permease [Helcococcus massiliensis]|uniref:FecCD family ABC transporter permease n=1 Tax=Helcococcus massiliensis TaxID=2040290 RepID=UPI000CDF07B2|nr:iron ABC transporter permease [Helcococcus massiliensis]
MFRRQKDIYILFAILLVILIISMFLSISIGSVNISLSEIFKIIFNGEQTENYNIFMNIRMVRVLFAMVSGMCLAISGLLLQIVLRNPMADSGFLGISSGASFATTLVLLIIPIKSTYVPIVSFIGGISAFFIILILSKKDSSPSKMILIGAALNAILRGGQSFLMTMYSDRLQGVITWQNGNLSGKTWGDLFSYISYVLPIILIIFAIKAKINVLNLSDESSLSIGVPVKKYRIFISSLSVFLAAVSVSYVGIIGFVGLLVPHIAKTLVGNNIKKTLPFSIVLGSILLLIADLFSRTIASPIEIPIGTVMSMIGGPFFIYLISKSSKGKKYA